LLTRFLFFFHLDLSFHKVNIRFVFEVKPVLAIVR